MQIKKLVLVLLLVGPFSTLSHAKDVDAGPIWNQQDAENKCPNVCKNHQCMMWNGQWTTTKPGEMSVCGCVGSVDKEAGPIYNQQDAEQKCPTTCKNADLEWNGQWTTTDPGKMSVCGCKKAC